VEFLVVRFPEAFRRDAGPANSRPSGNLEKPAGAPPPAPASGAPAPSPQPGSTSTEADTKAIVAALAEIGKLGERGHNVQIAAEVVRIHRAFMNDKNLEALMVACVMALSEETRPTESGRHTALAQICETEVFKGLGTESGAVHERPGGRRGPDPGGGQPPGLCGCGRQVL
jgi:hypothetical protein